MVESEKQTPYKHKKIIIPPFCWSNKIRPQGHENKKFLMIKLDNHQAFQIPKMEVLTYISCM